jgi:hypothetical protein
MMAGKVPRVLMQPRNQALPLLIAWVRLSRQHDLKWMLARDRAQPLDILED